MDLNESLCTVQALYDFTSTDHASLSFGQGDIIHVLAKLESGWWDGWCNGNRGWFPSNYVQEITADAYIPADITLDADAGLIHPSLDQPLSGLQLQQQLYHQELVQQPSRLDHNTTTNNNDQTNMVYKAHHNDTLLKQQQQQQPQQIIPPKTNWILQTTEDGSEVYYYNVVTKEMRYSLPADARLEPNLHPPSKNSISPMMTPPSPQQDISRITNIPMNGSASPTIHPNCHVFNINNSPNIPSATIPPSSPNTATTDQNINSLPPHWTRKVDTKGRVYYCNLQTDETTWHIDQIDTQTGNLFTNQSHDTNSITSNHENQPLNWDQLSTFIAHAIHGLKNSSRQGQTSLIRDDAAMVVHRIRLMLYVSNTVDKESSPYLKCNKQLRVFHRALLASLAKTVLSTKAASGTWSQDDALQKLQMDTDQLLMDVRNFLSTAQDLQLEIYDDQPRLLLPDLSKTLSSSSSTTSSSGNPSSNGHRWRLASSPMDGTNKPDLSTTLLVLADNVRGAMSSFMESVHNAFASLNDQSMAPNKVKTTAPLLVAQFRNLSNTASQFLNAVDDLPPQYQPQQQRRNIHRTNDNTVQKGYPARQAIYNAMGLLLISSQTITNADLPLSTIKMTYQQLEESICIDVTRAAKSSSNNSKALSHSHNTDTITRTSIHDVTPPTPVSRPNTLFEQDSARDLLDDVYADENIMGGGFDGIHPTTAATTKANRRKPSSIIQTSHPYHSPPSSTKQPPSASSSYFYHPPPPHQAAYSGSFYPNDDSTDVDSYQSSNRPYLNNGELSPTITTTAASSTVITSSTPPTPRAPKDKLAKFFGEDTILASKRRDTIVGPAISTMSSMTVNGTTGSASTITTGTGNSGSTAVNTLQTPTTAISTTTTTNSVNNMNGSTMMMGNEKLEYLCTDYLQNEIIFNMEGNVKGGTVMALVQRLTQHDQLDSKFINTFLLTYRSFCTTEELFTALFARYTLQPPAGLTDDEVNTWNEKKLKLVRLRVFNVIKSWLDSYYIEEEDRVMLPTVLSFSENVIRESMQFGAEQLGKAIQKRMNAEDSSQLRKMTLNVRTTEIPPPILPKNMKRLRFLEIDPLELARQLTMMDSKLYSRIKPVECLDKNWGRADSQHTAANVKASIEYSNQVTAWVTDSILSKEELKKRSAVVKHWVYVAEKCRLLHNYNTCMAILSAFDNSSVGRLKRTWETMSARTNAILTGIRRLMGANRNFTEYRDIIHKVNPPCIPFLGIYLQDLTFIEDGNSNFLKKTNNLINFAKRMKTGEVIRELQQYQSTPYILQLVPDIQEFIKTHLQSSRDEETLYNLSLAVEPRERGEDTLARRLKESGLQF
ncbi:ras guanine nucleotide exchange factor domain-containing protein [Absidia repens]|uniref:Ras guanine nucleotide exchange factor domain-containing protein n=1 Tax=Absidia repens TaxID=90262 RepID=A0A1X2IZL3_9FUNG|nr:ras guanine nucleotide exchange factor domain-containing protein [Absidia repens]